MLQGMTWASPPALRMPCATSSQASALRLEITTLAPSFASNSAEARPMPRLEPVMTATLLVRSNGVDFTFVSLLVIPGRAQREPGIQKLLSRDSGFDASHRPGMTGYIYWSFRDGPKDQTRNLEIPGSRYARPGMTANRDEIGGKVTILQENIDSTRAKIDW